MKPYLLPYDWPYLTLNLLFYRTCGVQISLRADSANGDFAFLER